MFVGFQIWTLLSEQKIRVIFTILFLFKYYKSKNTKITQNYDNYRYTANKEVFRCTKISTKKEWWIKVALIFSVSVWMNWKDTKKNIKFTKFTSL